MLEEKMSAAFGFPMPQSIVTDEATATDTYARFIAAPFQSGFGHTLGNSLRRVLLSSLEGAGGRVRARVSPVRSALSTQMVKARTPSLRPFSKSGKKSVTEENRELLMVLYQ